MSSLISVQTPGDLLDAKQVILRFFCLACILLFHSLRNIYGIQACYTQSIITENYEQQLPLFKHIL